MKTLIASILALFFVLYLGVASIAWEFNNPTANRMTVWTHFSDMMAFRSLPQFQERKP